MIKSNRKNTSFVNFAEKFTQRFSEIGVNDDNFHRIIMLYLVSFIGIIDLLLLGVAALLTGEILPGLLDIVVGLVLIINLILFRFRGHYLRACRVGLTFIGLLFFHLFYSGGVHDTGFMWLYSFPLFAFFLMGARDGGIATLTIYILTNLFLFLPDGLLPYSTSYSLDFKTRFIPSFFVVVVFAYIYEKFREKKQHQQEHYSEILEENVARRTKELQNVNEQLCYEINERREAEENVARAHERLQTILDGVDAIIYVADMESHELLFLNSYAIGVFGKGVGKKCWQVLQKDQTGQCELCTNVLLLDEHGNPAEPVIRELQNTVSNEWYDIHDRAISWHDGRLVRLEIATNITERKKSEADKVRLIDDLQAAVLEIKTLQGFLPICSYCKKIRDDSGYWNQLESYISSNTDATFSHGICPDCLKKHYPEFDKK